MNITKIASLALVSSLVLYSTGCGSGSSDSTDSTSPITEQTSQLKINEVLASNKTTIQDPDFNNYSDYIELYNASSSAIDLTGYGLADKVDADIWKFPSGTTIEPSSYLLIWADKEDSGLHTDFKLSASGESVILYDKSNNIIDQIDFTEQQEDIAITKDANNQIIFISPTPNQPNNIDQNKQDMPVDDTIIKPTSNVYINELMASNVQTEMDRDFYKFSDWIELYNQTDNDVDIGNYKLVDKDDEQGWSIPSGTTVPAHGYLIIWADDKSDDTRDDGKSKTELHTNFKLSDDSESLSLFDDTDKLIDKVNFTNQKADISYGRDKTNDAWGYMAPTFKVENASIYDSKDRADKPDIALSTNTVTITNEDGGTIYYTKDGSIPTQNSALYTAPITLSKTTAIRAVAIKDNQPPSKVVDKTIFINHSTTIPIVSLTTDAKYLFDNEIGIYTKGTNGLPLTQCMSSYTELVNYAHEWSRPVHLEYLTKDHEEELSFNLEFSITGQCSRDYVKKSFAFELDSKYGTKSLDYKLYPDKDLEKIKDFKLRGGNYGFEIGDTLAAALVVDGKLDVDYQAYQPVQMFMNGEYWGIYNIREKKGGEYIESNYPDVDKDKLDIMSAVVKRGNDVEYKKLRTYLKEHDLSNDTYYNEVLTMVDEDNFIDYMALMIYSANSDWVFSNFRCWREQAEDAKWRWMLDDVDYGFQYANINNNTFTQALQPGINMTDLFIGLLKNSTFKTKFKNRFYTLLDTTFTENNVIKIAEELASKKEGYMALDEEKWKNSPYGNINIITKSAFDNHILNVKKFATDRRDIVKAQLDAF